MEHTPDSSTETPDRLLEVMRAARLKARREAPPIRSARTLKDLRLGLVFPNLEEPSAEDARQEK